MMVVIDPSSRIHRMRRRRPRRGAASVFALVALTLVLAVAAQTVGLMRRSERDAKQALLNMQIDELVMAADRRFEAGQSNRHHKFDQRDQSGRRVKTATWTVPSAAVGLSGPPMVLSRDPTDQSRHVMVRWDHPRHPIARKIKLFSPIRPTRHDPDTHINPAALGS